MNTLKSRELSLGQIRVQIAKQRVLADQPVQPLTSQQRQDALASIPATPAAGLSLLPLGADESVKPPHLQLSY